MSQISILTPSYHADFERCKLLCESIDKYVKGYSFHSLIVNDDDYNLFRPLEGVKRRVMRYSDVIPSRLKVIPRVFKQDYWVSWNALPLKGWHVQQIVKIAATMKFLDERMCIIDSDMAFACPFDLTPFKAPNKLPFLCLDQVVPETQTYHSAWVKSSHKLLGLSNPIFPANDYIGNMVFWDKEAVHAMVKQIEQKTSQEWSTALNRARDFSEYMLYGNFVAHSSEFFKKHRVIDAPYFKTHWTDQTLNEQEIKTIIENLKPNEVIIGIQSFSNTPVEIIRNALGFTKT